MTAFPTDLLPCPFCGGDAIARTRLGGISGPVELVGCVKCGADTCACKTEQEAIAAWNSRAAFLPLNPPPPAVVEEVDIQPFGREKAEPFKRKVTANALAEAIAELATNDRHGLIQRVRWLIIRDRLSRTEPSPPAVAEGWQMVPVELTTNMRDSALLVYSRARLSTLWMTLLAAAPPPPAQGEG